MNKFLSKFPSYILSIVSTLPFVLIELNLTIWILGSLFTTIILSSWILVVFLSLTKDLEYKKVRSKFIIILTLSFFYIIFISTNTVDTFNSIEREPKLIPVIIIGHIFIGYGSLYMIRTLAVLIAKNEIGREPQVHEYLIYIFELVFFPIGIWWLNPKIKDLLSKK